uniref:Putative secreted peptide n=1 Tax=Anopheles braziliensis TaxID=58242 RepID=A0A2M3ZMX6_9DIPT
MPPDPVPVVRFRAAVVVVVVLRCFRLLAPPAAARGAEVGFDGDLLPLPTDVALAGVGILHRGMEFYAENVGWKTTCHRRNDRKKFGNARFQRRATAFTDC